MSNFKTALAEAGMFACLMASALGMFPRLMGQGTVWLDWMVMTYILIGLISGSVWIMRVKAESDKSWKAQQSKGL